MADIKTILRELSVILGFILAKYKLKFATKVINVNTYIDFIRKYCKNIDECDSEIQKIEKLPDFKIHKSIIDNGLKLGKMLYEKLKLEGEILWLGSEVKSKYPYDIKIGDVGISLKEDSYILKNPSFADYLNALIQPEKPFKEIHVFRKFAEKEFQAWFSYTINKLKRISKEYQDNQIIYSYEKRGTYITKRKNELIFGKPYKKVSIPISENINEVSFNKTLGGFLLEYTFSKWIKEMLEKKDAEYNKLKKICSEMAGANLKKYIESNVNLNSEKILELLQIYNKNYYYGKSFGEPFLYEVPANIECKVELRNIDIKVPKSQLNLYFTFNISNKVGINDITFRVESRYSHGQFKGIPEAKLYYTDNINHLKNLYKIIK
jgi:hypothetical protein